MLCEFDESVQGYKNMIFSMKADYCRFHDIGERDILNFEDLSSFCFTVGSKHYTVIRFLN
jgi:hypothetical protein